MANTIRIAEPIYRDNPVGQHLFYTVTNDTAVATQTKVKFVAEVYMDRVTIPTLVPANLVGTFKTTPNNGGSGMWDFRDIFESLLKADNDAFVGAKFQSSLVTELKPRPIHLIDQYSQSKDMGAYAIVKFYVEYVGANPLLPDVVQPDPTTETQSSYIYLFNGYVKNTDTINTGSQNVATQAFRYGFNIYDFTLSTVPTKLQKRFLTNMPNIMFAYDCDYGTVSMLLINNYLKFIRLTYRDADGVTIGVDNVLKNTGNGAYTTYTGKTHERILHFGCYPGNLLGWSPTYTALHNAGLMKGGKILVTPHRTTTQVIGQTYEINVMCDGLKGYKRIRLTWLNQFGGWDYYTFNLKSTRKIKTDASTYTQLGSTWNTKNNKLLGHRGGTKVFRKNAKEVVKMNTDYITEDYNICLEELINSPEVYMLECYNGPIDRNSITNTFTTPVRLLTSDWTYKTSANDRLVQYEFEVEISRTLRTQSI